MSSAGLWPPRCAGQSTRNQLFWALAMSRESKGFKFCFGLLGWGPSRSVNFGEHLPCPTRNLPKFSSSETTIIWASSASEHVVNEKTQKPSCPDFSQKLKDVQNCSYCVDTEQTENLLGSCTSFSELEALVNSTTSAR